MITNVDLNSICSRVKRLYPDLDTELINSGTGYFSDESASPIRGFDDYWHLREEVKSTFGLGDSFQESTLGLPKFADRSSKYDVGFADCAIRAWYYLGISQKKDLMYVPNDFRALFLDSKAMKKTAAAKLMLAKLQLRFEDMSKKNAEWLEEDLDATLRLPLIFNYLIGRSDSPADIIRLAFELRDSNPACSFREKCAELDNARKQGDSRLTNTLIQEMNTILKEIEQSININDQKKVERKITLAASIPLGISASYTFDLKRLPKHLVFIRKVFDGSRDPTYIESTYFRKKQTSMH
jgi:hypothetical protein